MLFLLIFALLFTLCSGACPNGSKEWKSNCYYFNSTESAFIVAEETCINLGGHLVSIHDAFANQFLAQNAALQFHESTVSDFWIGCSNLGGNWSWMDGSNLTFTEWNSTKNLTGEVCAVENISNGKWNSDDCFKVKPFVCEVSSIPTNPPFIECGGGWIYFEKTGYCYGGVAGDKPYNWSDGENLCQKSNAHLISIHNEEEYQFLYSMSFITWRWFWTGLTSNDNEHSWHYSDETPFDYANWATGFPKMKKSSCVSIPPFKDFDCSSLLYPICKRKP